MAREHCDSCLTKLSKKLSQEDYLILSALHNNKSIEPLFAVDKAKIISMVKEITDFKFQISISKLEAISLVNRTSGRPSKFYITEDGIVILKIFMRTVKNNMEGKR